MFNHPMVPKIDLHVHSQFSPCSKDTTIESIVSVAEEKKLEKIAITDHGKVEKPQWCSVRAYYVKPHTKTYMTSA